MPDPIRCALFTPISTHQKGNGLAHRARFWHEVLSRFGSVTTIVVPLAGRPPPRQPNGIVEEIVSLADTSLPTDAVVSAHLPIRARMAPEFAGRVWRSPDEVFDLVVVLRTYCAPFAFGVVAETDALVIVDCDDDDATFHDDAGDHEEAARYRTLLTQIERRAARVVSVTGFGSTVAVANSVEYAPARSAPGSAGRRVIMVGNFGYSPNVDGARWFIDEVLPLVDEIDFVIAGPGSHSLTPHGIGFVEDINALYASAQVVVVPLLSGSGSRIKAIEAFAAGVPVVGTTVGMSGLHIRPGVDCVVADEPTEFAAALRRLLDEPDVAHELAASALADVVPQYSRRFVADGAQRLLEECLNHAHQG